MPVSISYVYYLGCVRGWGARRPKPIYNTPVNRQRKLDFLPDNVFLKTFVFGESSFDLNLAPELKHSFERVLE